MKHLFFTAVIMGAISAAPNSAGAQTSVNIEKLSRSKRGQAPKFIECIEINPLVSKSTETVKENDAAETTAIATGVPSVTAAPAIEGFSTLQFKYAQLMDVEVESISNLPLFSFIDEWWGTRYRYGGQDKKGIDCSAFCGKLMQQVYGKKLERMAKDQFRQSEKIANEDLKEGDLVFFNTRGGVSHVGFYLGNSFFVHSSTNSGVTISSLNDEYYSKRFISGGRIACE